MRKDTKGPTCTSGLRPSPWAIAPEQEHVINSPPDLTRRNAATLRLTYFLLALTRADFFGANLGGSTKEKTHSNALVLSGCMSSCVNVKCFIALHGPGEILQTIASVPSVSVCDKQIMIPIMQPIMISSIIDLIYDSYTLMRIIFGHAW